MKKPVEERVKEIIVDIMGCDDEQLTPKALFVDDLGADSLDQIEIVMGVEEAFDLEIPDEDAEKILTVQQAIDYVKSKTEKVRLQ